MFLTNLFSHRKKSQLNNVCTSIATDFEEEEELILSSLDEFDDDDDDWDWDDDDDDDD